MFGSLYLSLAPLQPARTLEKKVWKSFIDHNLVVMASIMLFLLASALISVVAQQRQSSILPGSSLTPITNSSWLSNSGLYAFGFYKQGNGYAVGIFLAGIPQKTVVWTANRDGQPVSDNSTLLFTSNGSFVLRMTESQNYSIGDPLRFASSASMLDSGNFVLYNSSGKVIWQSFDHPTDTLLPTQDLLPGKELISSVSETDHSTGIFRLKMQEDGNLVQYPVGAPDTAPNSYYTSWTDRRGPGVTLNFDVNGHLYLLNATGFNIRNITSGGNSTKETIYRLRIDADGIFRLYSYDNEKWSIEWSSSKDKCDPKGLCGVNGFCITNDAQASCVCLPGFKFVNENWTAGCEKDFIADGCGNNQNFTNTTRELRNTTYSMQELRNTTWEYVPYSFVLLSEVKYCQQACLEDCDCEAAFFFQEGICGKHKLPLRYGRQQLVSNVVLIKVAMAATTGNSSDRFVPLKGKKLRKDILIIGISLAVFGLTMLAISIIVFCKSYRLAFERIYAKVEAELRSEDLGPRSYSYSELERITEGFKEEIGKGASGTVYKGLLLKNVQKLVAVKRLENLLCDGEKEFQNEVKVIGKTHHRNLVRLVGFCLDGPNRLLVYDYMSNGSLADVLFAPKNKPSWDKRMRIACNIARGIHYLHEECVDQIIHCDIKPQNVLMDETGCAKISDFGLAKLLQPDQTKTFTGIRGTRGYVAPEWHLQMPVTVKVDVYSFGIVVLEIICCRRGVDWNLPEEEAVLDEWAYHCFENGELGKLVGNHEEIDMQQFEMMIKVGLWCIQYEPSQRPSIKMVLHMMEGLVDVPIPPTFLNSSSVFR